MAHSPRGTASSGKSTHKNTPLSLEKLEDRMMFALGSLQEQLRFLTSSPPTFGPTLPVAPLLSNAAPTLAASLNVNSPSVVRTKSTTLSILGSDDKGESNLTYAWKVDSSSDGGTVSFSVNGKNGAKQTQATFSKPGLYTIRATITDREGLSTSDRIDVTVVPTLTSIAFQANGKTVATGSTTSVVGISQRLSAVGLDQFGSPLGSQPSFDWSSSLAPPNATPTILTGSDGATINFAQAGAYAIKATSGSISATTKLNVVQSLTTATVSIDGSPIQPGASIVLASTTQKVSIQGFDQFGAKLASRPNWTWTAMSATKGAAATFATTNELTTIGLNRAAAYSIKVQSDKVSISFGLNVSQTFARIAVLVPGTTSVSTNVTVNVTSTSQRFLTQAQDQFGVAMVNQPQIDWTIVSTPISGAATLSTGNEGTIATFDRSGTYTFRVASGNIASNITTNVIATLARISLTDSNGNAIKPNSNTDTAAPSIALTIGGYDQFGFAMPKVPTIAWSASSTSSGLPPSVTTQNGVATIHFNRAANYSIKAQSGSISLSLGVTVAPVFTKLVTQSSDGKVIANGGSLNATGTNLRVAVRGLDQFGNVLGVQPTIAWSTTSTPTDGSATTTPGKEFATIAFTKAGSYGFSVQSNGLSSSFVVNLTAVLTSITLTPASASMDASTSQQLTAQGFDQFQNALTNPPTLAWTASSGTITSSGLYTAPNKAGTYTITAKSGTLSASVKIAVVAPAPTPTPTPTPAPTPSPTPTNGLQNAALSSLVSSLDADGSLSRSDMIAILRSTGNDGIVDSTELNDLRYLLANSSTFHIASFVQVLAGDVVNGNAANARYLGQAAGNLVAGSSASLLNNLVDKWFLGTDAPTINNSSLTYKSATGTLFVGEPSHLDEHQGMLGDCYFISTIGKIADRNPNAIRNMFVDNGDGTFTVRFYANGVADYVTVDRRLPTYSNGVLGYSGYGSSVTSTTNPLWIPLAEKAYAQWNETGKEGRNGTNTYAGIEGGWMAYVDAQILGKPAASYNVASNTKQAMIDGLNSNKAITIGTNSSVGNGLVGGHAYGVIGYNASNDTFVLYNPWGNTQPGALTWAQIMANCSAFVVADASSSTPIVV